MPRAKIVPIGAGSASFGAGTINSLLVSPELAACGLRTTLVDTDSAALQKVLRYASAVHGFRGLSAMREATTDRTQALSGAQSVVTSASVRRYRHWGQDLSIPRAFGFRHPYGDCGGPGAGLRGAPPLSFPEPDAGSPSPLRLISGFAL
jgi:alpha-galactosidase